MVHRCDWSSFCHDSRMTVSRFLRPRDVCSYGNHGLLHASSTMYTEFGRIIERLLIASGSALSYLRTLTGAATLTLALRRTGRQVAQQSSYNPAEAKRDNILRPNEKMPMRVAVRHSVTDNRDWPLQPLAAGEHEHCRRAIITPQSVAIN